MDADLVARPVPPRLLFFHFLTPDSPDGAVEYNAQTGCFLCGMTPDATTSNWSYSTPAKIKQGTEPQHEAGLETARLQRFELSQRYLLSRVSSADSNLGKPIALEPVPMRPPSRLRPVSNLPVVLEQQVTHRYHNLMSGEESSRASMVAISKGREVCCRRDELTSLWVGPG
ncbi:hypothetical protein FJTKL_14634 [Diaporthe vaccinii]|uniref:Uncharacterized protein n=1 Tax=Diaporthe vaccinii TaxID=105482 RepID=A0ABR4E719_9PEZI